MNVQSGTILHWLREIDNCWANRPFQYFSDSKPHILWGWKGKGHCFSRKFTHTQQNVDGIVHIVYSLMSEGKSLIGRAVTDLLIFSVIARLWVCVWINIIYIFYKTNKYGAWSQCSQNWFLIFYIHAETALSQKVCFEDVPCELLKKTFMEWNEFKRQCRRVIALIN